MLYKTGNYTQKEILDFLTDKIKHRKVSTGMLERMLENPFYYGLMKTKYGKRMGVLNHLSPKKSLTIFKESGVKGPRAILRVIVPRYPSH